MEVVTCYIDIALPSSTSYNFIRYIFGKQLCMFSNKSCLHISIFTFALSFIILFIYFTIRIMITVMVITWAWSSLFYFLLVFNPLRISTPSYS